MARTPSHDSSSAQAPGVPGQPQPDLPFPTLHQLQTFLAVVKHRGVPGAMEELGTKDRQSVHGPLDRLDKVINKIRDPLSALADEDSIQLLEDGRTSTTQAGQQLLGTIRRITKDMSTLIQQIQNLDPGTAVVRVGAYPAHMPLVAAARKQGSLRTPAIRVPLSDVDDDSLRSHSGAALTHMVRGGQLDIAIVPEFTPNTRLATHALYSWQLLAVMPAEHELASASTLTWADLDGHDLLMSPERHASRSLVPAAMRPAHTSTNTDVLVAMAVDGHGVAVLPSDVLAVGWASRAGACICVPIVADGREVGGSYVAVTAANPRPSVTAIVDQLVEASAQLREQQTPKPRRAAP